MVKKSLVAGGLLVLAAACQLVAGIDRVDKTTAVADIDAGDAAASVSPDPCQHKLRPPRPANDDPTTGAAPDVIYLAIQATHLLGTDTAGAVTGFDLDGTCTCDTRPFTAEGGAPSCTGKQQVCDDEGGVDNVSAGLFKTFAFPGVNIDDAAGVNAGIAQGTRGVIISISDYNGEANDLSVVVGLFLSYGIFEGDGCANAPSDKDARKFKPGFCGKDKWSINPTQTLRTPDGRALPTATGKGWVTDHQLVFEGQVPFKIFFGDAALSVGNPLSVGTLSKVTKNGASLWHLDGTLAGRAPVGDLLQALGTFRIPSTSTRFCQTAEPFGSIKQTICNSLDIASCAEFDFRDRACDAISTSITFESEETGLGATSVDESQADTACQDAGTDPSLYSCN